MTPTSDANLKSSLSPTLLTDHTSEVPTTPSLDSITCCTAHRTQENSLCTRLLVYYEGCNSGTARWKGCIDQGGCKEVPSPLHTYHPPSTYTYQAFWTPELLDLYGGYRMQAWWLNHWPLVTELNLLPLSPSQRSGRGCKFQLSNHTVVSPANQPHLTVTYGLSKNPLIDMNSGVVERNLLLITKDTHFSFIALIT